MPLHATTKRAAMRAAVIATLALAPLWGAAGVAAEERGAPIVLAQNNGFLPNLFGNRERQPDDTALRIEQLENQVRLLTGEIERLTFEVRDLRARLDALGGTAPAATPGAGAPATGRQGSGPVDLGRLAQGAGGATAGAAPVTTAPDAAAAFEDARTLHAGGRLAEAERELRAFLKMYPTDANAGEAAFLIGDILSARGAHREAANVFLASYTDYPDSPRAPESLLRLGTSLKAMGEREAACSSFEELLGAYPDASPEIRAAASREIAATGCG